MATTPDQGAGGRLTKGLGVIGTAVALTSLIFGAIVTGAFRYADVVDRLDDAEVHTDANAAAIIAISARLDNARDVLEAKLDGQATSTIGVIGRVDLMNARIGSIEAIIKERIDVNKALFDGLNTISQQQAVTNQILGRLEKSVDAIEARRGQRSDQQ